MAAILSLGGSPSRIASLAWPLATVLAMLCLALQSGLLELWIHSEEYGHGAAVIAVLGYLIYRRRSTLPQVRPSLGLAVLAAGLLPLAVMLLGSLTGITQLQMYGVWLYAVSVTYVFGGLPLLGALAVPLGIALMTIPLPSALEWALTAKLQLLSSELGVWFIRQLGGVALLQGNVIDMGNLRLLVDEACSGLRYLYPLMGLGAIAAFVFVAPLWARWVLFLATVPITILMNSLRIGITGLLADRYGTAHTEGFLHFFEGWVVFVAALMALWAVAGLLLRLHPSDRGVLDAFSVAAGSPQRRPAGQTRAEAGDATGRSVAGLPVMLSLLVAVLAGPALASRAEVFPMRQTFAEFPLQLGQWTSLQQRLPLAIEEVAGASDYYYGNFSAADGHWVNLYLSYYASQRSGTIPHSPLVCLPGDGWQVVNVTTTTIPRNTGPLIEVSRLIATKGDRTLVGYYWLKQGPAHHHRGAVARLDLLRSAAVDRRSDGALVRLVSEVGRNENFEQVDRRLQAFAGELIAVLPGFVPD